MRSISIAVLLATLAQQTIAHGTVNTIRANGQTYKGYEPSNSPGTKPKAATGVVWASNDQDIGFVLPEDYANANIICHKNAVPASKSIPLAAGDTMELEWPEWPKTDPHPGVFLNYLASTGSDDFASVDKTHLKFFKISQLGADSSVKAGKPDYGLATGSFKKAGMVATVTIPTDIKPGKYVLRHEIIALHEADQENGAQNYPQCVNIEVTGSGTVLPDGVLGTQLYKEDDPGILVSLYDKFSAAKYQMPGPALYDNSGTAGTGTSPSIAPSQTGQASSKSTAASYSSAKTPSNNDIVQGEEKTQNEDDEETSTDTAAEPRKTGSRRGRGRYQRVKF